MKNDNSIYPLETYDHLTGEVFLLWRWTQGLRVEKRLLSSQFPAIFYQTFFSESGALVPALASYLPLDFTDWVATIPLDLRQAVGRLAGRNPRCPQLFLLGLMKQNQVFRDWIMQLAHSGDGAYLRIAWCLAELEDSPPVVHQTWLFSLVGQARHVLLSQLLNRPFSAAQIKRTRKLQLDEQAWSRSDINLFFQQLANPLFIKVLDQAESIRLWALDYLLNLPSWLWQGQIWQRLCEWPQAALAQSLPPLILQAPIQKQSLIVKALKKSKSRFEFNQALMRLIKQLVEMKPFPAPPLEGNALLMPITTAQALEQEGALMQHCVGGYVSSVVSGLSYFYHWSGDRHLPLPLTLQLSPYPKSTQWQLVEALGYENQQIEAQDWDYLRQQLAKLNPPWGYLLLKTQIVGLGYSDYPKVFDKLEREMTLKIYREANNPFDDLAIRIDTPDGDKLGYVSKVEQAVLNPFFNSNSPLHARLNFLKPDYATINVYLKPESG